MVGREPGHTGRRPVLEGPGVWESCFVLGKDGAPKLTVSLLALFFYFPSVLFLELGSHQAHSSWEAKRVPPFLWALRIAQTTWLVLKLFLSLPLSPPLG